jgi:putative phage-type endonuclease
MNAAEQRPTAFEFVCKSDGSDEWISKRSLGIGASEIAIVLGESNWSSLLELYYRKIGESAHDDSDPEEWILWGRLLEDPIRAELCKRAGVTVKHVGPLLRSTSVRWAIATPDGLTDALEPIEAKNISWGYDPDEWAARIPIKYYLQCQQQILVTGASRCLFGALLWGSKLIWEWVPRDEIAIKRILTGGESFWRNVERRTPPPSDGHPGARRLLGKMAIVDNQIELYEPDISDLLEGWSRYNQELVQLRDKERKVERHRDSSADQIAQRMGVHRKAFTATGWEFRWETVRSRGYTAEPKTFEQLKIKAPRAPKE